MNYMSRIIRALRRKVSDYKLRRKILKSDLFSLRWYLEAYTDVAEAGVDPYQHYLESGWREGRNPGPKFDTNGYLAANPDVRNAGVNPLVHYIVSGKAEGRLLNTEYLRRSPRRKPASRNADQAGVVVFEKSILSAPTDDHRFAVFSVAFMVADQKGESTRYRVHNVIEALRRRNVEAVHFEDQDIPGRMEQILSNDIVVLFRYPWGPDVEQLIAQAREKAIPLVYDVDDYIFDPAVSSRIDGVRMLTEPDKALYQKGVLRYRKCLENCDYATAPTEFLARMQTDLVKKSYVIVNTLNREQLQICQEIVSRETITRSDWVTLGYFSGSLTHQKDFEQALPSLLRVFEDFLNVRLIIKGEFELDEFPGLRRFEDRIALKPFSHWRELPLAISQVDINLIPLEPNSLFCESKSELKYFEAAILGKPSVASEVGPYKNVIEHGRNGLLAQNPETWYECLRCLIVDPSFRKSLGEAAREHVLKNYVPEKLAQDAETVYQDILDDYRRRKRRVSRKNRTSVSFITPCPKPGSGGHKDIFVLSNVLADLGSEVNIYFVPSPEFSSSGQLEDMLFTHFLEPRFNVILGVDVAPCDALFATHFSTAYHVKENLFAAKKGFYFVQDYEPYFYPVSEDYIRAVTT
ncbi:MAG: glycosyltransferase family 4 protein, partial [Blastocatellia bacterium]